MNSMNVYSTMHCVSNKRNATLGKYSSTTSSLHGTVGLLHGPSLLLTIDRIGSQLTIKSMTSRLEWSQSWSCESEMFDRRQRTPETVINLTIRLTDFTCGIMIAYAS